MEERLRKFAKVAETKSFTRAANTLHTSQPALSVAIAKLERELGAVLIDRDTLQLTGAGQLAYRHAQNTEVQRSNLYSQLQKIKNQKPHFALGIIDSLADTLLISSGQLAKIEKKATVTLSVNNSRYLLNMLAVNQLDLACVVYPSELPKKFISQSLGSEPLLGVTGSGLSESIRVQLKQGHINNFLAYDQSSHTSRLIQRYFASKQLNLQSVFHSTSPEIILHMVLAGRGSAVLPFALVQEHIKNGNLMVFTSVIDRKIAAVWHQDRLLPEVVDDLWKNAKKLLNKQYMTSKALTVL